jgi:hypothetical protein
VVAESRPAFWECPLPMGPTPTVKDMHHKPEGLGSYAYFFVAGAETLLESVRSLLVVHQWWKVVIILHRRTFNGTVVRGSNFKSLYKMVDQIEFLT